MESTALQDALRGDAIAALRNATLLHNGFNVHSAPRNIVVAVDAANHVVLEVLSYGAGGQQLFADLHISRLVSIDTTSMDATALRTQVGLSGGSSSRWPDHTIAFVVAPSQANAQLIAHTLQPFLQSTEIQCTVLWLPAATSECTLEMERQGLAGIVTQRNLSLGLLPVDRNVATLCQDKVFAELYVHGQHHALTRVVQSLLAIEKHTSFQEQRGRFGHVTCLGTFATRVKNMLDMAHQLQAPQSSLSYSTRSKFERLILIDRMEDPLSMLLTPMTYEGLLDALIGMNHGVVSFEKPVNSSGDKKEQTESTTSSRSSSTERVKLVLNHTDDLFEEIRDVNINTLISHRLAEISERLVHQVRGGRSNTTAASNTVATTLAQLKQQLQKVPHLVKTKRALANHLVLVEQIQQRSQNLGLRTCVETEMAILSTALLKRGFASSSSSSSFSSTIKDIERVLEEAMLRDDPPLLDAYDVLKLLCLLSLVTGGLKAEKLQWFRQQLCHSYGYQLLPLLVQLEKLELLSTTNKFDYHRRRKELSLMRDPTLDSTPHENASAEDIHFMFPYTGYAPMSVRLVQRSLGMKIKPTKELGGLFGNSNTHNNNSSSASITSSTHSAESDADADDVASLFGTASSSVPIGGDGGGSPRRHVLVYYLGGVTVAELAAYRWLNSAQREFEFFVATTAICNSNRMLRAIG